VSTSPDPESWSLVYEESVRGLDRQSGDIDALRSQAGTLLAVAALVSGFLGTEVLKVEHDHLDALAWGGLAAFVAAVVLATAILLPRKWILSNSPGDIIENYIESKPPRTVDEIRRDLALWNEINSEKNGRWIKIYAGLFALAALALLAETIIWLLALGRS
jgi:hypothetical protein